MLFSRTYAAKCLETVRGQLDARTIDLYEGSEFFHEAYIEKIEFTFSAKDHSRATCRITVRQQHYTAIPARMVLTLDGVKFFDFDLQKKFNFLGAEIYWLYISDAGDNFEVRCSTDRLIEFTATAEELIITPEQGLTKRFRQ